MRKTIFTHVFIIALCTFSACGDDDGTICPGNGAQPTRSFALGFTDFPHAMSLDAIIAAIVVIAQDADMAVMHFDDGVPWQEALDGSPYHPNYEYELDRKVASIPSEHLTYLAVTPIAFSRDTLADYWGEQGSMPLPPPWDSRGFDHPEVITAFTNHCNRMIDRFSPDFFAYAIEANMLITLEPSGWNAFVTLAEAVYTSVKSSHPALPVSISLQTDFYHQYQPEQGTRISDVLPYTDFITVSTYPFGAEPDPEALPSDHFSAIAGLAPGKPFAVAETAWPAEDITAPYPMFIPATEADQLAYVDRLLDDADRLDAAFVCWFFTRDYDELWDSYFRFSPDSALTRFWRDTGMYDEDGNARPALDRWRESLEMPRE